jgi:hypothetical protein
MSIGIYAHKPYTLAELEPVISCFSEANVMTIASLRDAKKY